MVSDTAAFNMITFTIPEQGIYPVSNISLDISSPSAASVFVRNLFILACHQPFVTTSEGKSIRPLSTAALHKLRVAIMCDRRIADHGDKISSCSNSHVVGSLMQTVWGTCCCCFADRYYRDDVRTSGNLDTVRHNYAVYVNIHSVSSFSYCYPLRTEMPLSFCIKVIKWCNSTYQSSCK